jgi:outer membrane biosynthesis protein TonB
MTTTEEHGTELAVDDRDPRDRGTIEILPPARPMGIEALGMLREQVGAMREAKLFADIVCTSKLIPQRFQGEPGDGAAAILYGAELGLSPMASLRSVIVVHGQPGLEARTMKGLLKSKGYGFRTVEQGDTVHEIWAWEPDSPKVYDDEGRRIAPDETARITMDDCRLEGWVPIPVEGSQLRPQVKKDWEGEEKSGRNGSYFVVRGNMKYITSPRTMLRAKATAEVCRAIAPHILLGLPYSTDELADFDDDWAADDQPQARRQPAKARGMDGLRDRARQAKRDDDIHDAEVVEDEPATDAPEPAAPADAPEPTPAAPDQQPAETSPATPKPDDTPAADPTPDSPPEPEHSPDIVRPDPADTPVETPPAATPEGDVSMTADRRAKGMSTMHALFGEGGVKNDERDLRLGATAEIIAKKKGATYRAVASSNDLRNDELLYLVETLQRWKKQGNLERYMNEAINAASLREAGLNEGDS